jgi:hypothetical protein
VGSTHTWPQVFADGTPAADRARTHTPEGRALDRKRLHGAIEDLSSTAAELAAGRPGRRADRARLVAAVQVAGAAVRHRRPADARVPRGRDRQGPDWQMAGKRLVPNLPRFHGSREPLFYA